MERDSDKEGLTPLHSVQSMSSTDLLYLQREFWDFSLYHGNQMKIHTDPVNEAYKGHTSNTTLIPTRLSRLAYERVLSVQPLYNSLYHSIANDRQFLMSALKSVRGHDEFMERHLEIYQRLNEENVHPSVQLAMSRSDYLLHGDLDTLKQVEFNTMAAAASGVNRAATLWHRYVTGTLMHLDDSNIPDNNATNMLAKAMVTSWQLYGNKEAVIVILTTGPTEFNFADQRSLQYDIHGLNKRIEIARVQFDTLSDETLCLDVDRKLFINGMEVAVVYYRAGYTPRHYIRESLWEMRYRIEKSLAIKCPSVSYVLAGTKRVQQLLTQPGVVEKWMDGPSSKQIRETFVGFHSFDKDEEGEATVALARECPDKYVMKPQRDGGGNNIYGADIVAKIDSSTFEELSAYTLMERIQPPANENYIMRKSDTPEVERIVSELGIFGAYIVKNGQVLMNETAGFLYRSKPSHKNEGDLMRGTSSLDSPWLF